MGQTVTLAVVLLAIAVALHLDAPRQARRLALRTPTALVPATARGRDALVAELTARLRISAVGSAIGTLAAGVPLVVRQVGADGPEGLTVVATLLGTTVVASVAAEAVAVLRRTPSVPAGPRTAALTPRQSHDGGGERVAEVALWALAALALVLGVAALAEDVDGAAGAVGCGIGALVVIAACSLVRGRFLRRPVVARDTDDLAVDAAAGRATVDRFNENLVASGGVLVLASLLVPALTWPGAGRTIAVALGAATLLTMVVLASLRRHHREQVPA